jgi:hypothetical protein
VFSGTSNNKSKGKGIIDPDKCKVKAGGIVSLIKSVFLAKVYQDITTSGRVVIVPAE